MDAPIRIGLVAELTDDTTKIRRSRPRRQRGVKSCAREFTF